MSLSWRRRAADLVGSALLAALPARLRPWGQGIQAEISEIPDDSKALLFALGSFCGLVPWAMLAQVLEQLDGLVGGEAAKATTTEDLDVAKDRLQAVGILCAAIAVALGLAYLAVAGAPAIFIEVNAIALAIGLTLLAIIGRVTSAVRLPAGVVMFVPALLLLATSVVGVRVDGVARWLRLSALLVQPSLLLLPAMLVAFARSRSPQSAAALVIAAVALALQPDRAMAAVMVAGLATLAILRCDRLVTIALAASLLAFLVTLIRADSLAPSAFVEQVIRSAFELHLLAGTAVIGGSALLLVPAMIGWRHDPESRHVHAVFGIVWLTATLAAAIGNYPTPVVGYGGSAVIGYVIGLAMLPRRTGTRDGKNAEATGAIKARSRHCQPRVVVA
jgi:hypothetical protein